ncbi:MAG: HAD family hydrolase [Deltaproteobacteria bacterium]|nr:HAD family hydrolase [Deltaproteobacteria bacterium]
MRTREGAAGELRAVLFDLDGTLLDSLEDLADSMNAVLRRFGFPVHPVGAYRRFVGDGMEVLVRRTVPERARDAETLRRALDEMRAEYGGRHAEKTRPYRGIPELLGELARRRVPFAILSNKPDDATKLVVREVLGTWSFRAVLGARPGRPKKPDPTAALEIAAALGIPAGQWIYLGDTDTDMLTAEAAGMVAVGALWGFRDAGELTSAGARGLLRDPLELLRWLEPHPPGSS